MLGNRVRHVLSFVVVMALMVAACGDSVEESDGADGTTAPPSENTAAPAELTEVDLLLPFLESIFYHGITIAREMGYFAEEGLELTTQDSGGSSFVTQQLVGGGFEFGYNTPAETLSALARGVEVKIVYNQETGNIFGIRVPIDSDIQSVADLEGRTLGITDFGGGEVPLVRAVLQSAGLGFDEDVEIQVVGPGGPLAVSSLQDGTVDAYAGAVNDWAALQALGLELRDILPPEYDNQPGDVLMMPSETFEDPQGRQMAIGIARAISKGSYFGQLNEEAGLCIMKEFLPEEHEDPDFARTYYQEVQLLQVPVDSGRWGEQDLAAWEFIQQQLLDGDAYEDPVDIDMHVTNELIEEINDWDRSAVEADSDSVTVTYPGC